MVGLLPIRLQAAFWWRWAQWRYGKTSHFRIEAIRKLRKTGKLTLKQAEEYYPRPP